MDAKARRSIRLVGSAPHSPGQRLMRSGFCRDSGEGIHVGNPVILTDGGPLWQRDSVIRGSGLPKPRAPDLRASKLCWLSASSGTLRIGRGLSTTTSTRRKRCSCRSWTSWSYSSRGTRSGGDKNWAYPDRSYVRGIWTP